MQNSGNSSPETQSPSPSLDEVTRKRFSLTGVSIAIDPRVDAVRPDLADVRLADRVFAPHYAAPMARTLATATSLRSKPATDSDVLAALDAGSAFEVLEFAGTYAWGVAPAAGFVGYIDANTLAALEL